MKLAHYQIQHIEDFVKSQRIHYTDIRHELTDHIASAVEEKMEASEASFGEAFSETIKGINCFGIQRQKIMSETLGSWKVIIGNALNLFKGYRLLLLTLISFSISYLYMNMTNTGKLDDWFSTILKIIIVAPVIYSILDRRQKPHRFSFFMTSVVGLYLLVEIITATKTFVVDNLLPSEPLGQSIYFSLAFFITLTGYGIVFKTYQRVRQTAIH